MVRAVRGAITVKKNSSEDILMAVKELLGRVIGENGIEICDMISILFTMTSDLNADFPAKAAREMGLTGIPLMCSNEIDVKGSLKKCIRLMLHFNTEKENKDIIHVYMRDAGNLRPDLTGGYGG